MLVKVKVWDLPVRVFHWSQVLLLAGLWYTGNEGLMAQHQLLAYSFAAILIARICWGFYGSQTARFSHFAASPLRAMRYLRHTQPVVGHNPAGSYMIFLLLLLMALQLLTGLATYDNSYISDGPLVRYLSEDWVSLASRIHKWNIDIILACVAIHVLAGLWHSLRHDNVIAAMLTGSLRLPSTLNPPKLQTGWSFFLLVLVLLVVFYLWQGQMLIRFL